MFKKRPVLHDRVQLPISLRDTTLFDAEGNVWCVDEEREKILNLFPKTSLTLTKHSTTKPFVDSQVQNSINETMRLWREEYVLPELSKIAPNAQSYLEECAREAKRSCMKKLLEVLSAKGAECFKEIVDEMLSDIEQLATKKVALVTELEKQSPQLLPYGTRFHWNLKPENDNYQIFCIENAPQQRTINIMGERKRLAFPWIYFITIFINGGFFTLYVFYRNTPITSLDDMLYLPNLPNIRNETLECCLGGYKPYFLVKDKKWPEALFTYFWGSSFFETSPTYLQFYEDAAKKIPELKNLDTWETMSNENPLFVLALPWKEHVTLRTFIDKLLVKFNIATKIAAAHQENQDSWNTIKRRYTTDFSEELAVRLHTLCSTTSPKIDTTYIAHERLVALFKEIEKHLTTTLEDVHTSISDTLSTSIAHTMNSCGEEKHL